MRWRLLLITFTLAAVVVGLELVWMRLLALDIGSSMRASCIVVAFFFIGGAAGQAIGAWGQGRDVAPGRWIAGCAAALLASAGAGWYLRLGLGPFLRGAALPNWLGDMTLTLIVVAVPAAAAAVAFPALIAAAVARVDQRARNGALLAAIDLLGAVGGLAGGGFLLGRLELVVGDEAVGGLYFHIVEPLLEGRLILAHHLMVDAESLLARGQPAVFGALFLAVIDMGGAGQAITPATCARPGGSGRGWR